MMVELAIAITVWVMMFAVGLDLTWQDFRRVVELPRAVVVGTLAQLALLPIAATALVALLTPSPLIAAGMLLIAACPGGAISNFYCYLAAANTALSVTLTALSTVLAVVTLPLILSIELELVFGREQRLTVPVLRVFAQLLMVVLLPVALGMSLRRAAPAFVAGNARHIRRLGVAALLALVVLIVHDQAAAFRHELALTVVLALVFTALAMAAGWSVARMLGLDMSSAFVFLVEFSARNLGIGAVVAAASLARPELIAFGTVFFLTQAVVMIAGIAVYRRAAARTLSPG